MKSTLLAASAIAITYTPIALSHPGHDHSHWAASSVHFITAASIVGAIAAIAYAFKKNQKKSDNQEH